MITRRLIILCGFAKRKINKTRAKNDHFINEILQIVFKLVF